jgi:hypothetical protein
MWNGQFFERSDLLTQLCLDLCHHPDDCPSTLPDGRTHMTSDLDVYDDDDDPGHVYQPPEASESTTNSGSKTNVTIVSSNGIFQRSIRWCRCAKSAGQYVQLLLRAKLFPASFKNPKTAFTFEVLDHFQLDSLECKTAAMNFMSKIRRITNEVFPALVPVSHLMDQMMFPLLSCSAGSLSRVTQSLQRVAGSSQLHQSWGCTRSAR